jgi:hypothetical protein
MKLTTLVLLASMLSPSAANAEDLASLQQRVYQLENRTIPRSIVQRIPS